MAKTQKDYELGHYSFNVPGGHSQVSCVLRCRSFDHPRGVDWAAESPKIQGLQATLEDSRHSCREVQKPLMAKL